MWMAKFAPRVTEDEIRAARRRIAAGESKRSVARSLGYSGSSPHKALQQRIDAQDRREDCERLERQTRGATAEAEKKRIARVVRTGDGQVQRTTETPERGATFPERSQRVRGDLERAKIDEGRKRYADPEAEWLAGRDSDRTAEERHRRDHPEEYVRFDLIDLTETRRASKTGETEALATAARLADRYGPLELRAQ
jgi:hypothetical protein